MSFPQEQSLWSIQDNASQKDWIEIIPGFFAKVLLLDQRRNGVEFLMKVSKEWLPGTHRHVCETSIYVIDGSIANESTGKAYGAGDYFYQAAGNTHFEVIGEQGFCAFVRMQSDSDRLVEFLDDEGAPKGSMNVSHFAGFLV